MDKNKIENNSTPPLYKGKNFLCYRDVNKAIEKHREMFGLRLALKRAIKLENYHLTVEQMKDLNLRLKYGELDYHCFAATGRPGRPGNDERCPQLVRLKLSSDAQSLVVYESHNHDILLSHESVKPFPLYKQKKDFIPIAPNTQTCLKGDITLTAIGTVTKSPVLILPKPPNPLKDKLSTSTSSSCPSGNFIIDNNNSFTSIIPLPHSSMPLSTSPHTSEVNTITITPTPPLSIYPPMKEVCMSSQANEKNEKLTMKIKKSENDPNEMVIVGAEQESTEQQKCKSIDDESAVKEPKLSKSPESTSKEASKHNSSHVLPTTKQDSSPAASKDPKSSLTTSKPGNTPKVINAGAKSSPCSTPEGGKPIASAPKTTPQGSFQKVTTSNDAKSIPNASQKPLNVSQKPNMLPKSNSAANKPTVLRQSPNMKQIIIKKPPQIGVGIKPSTAKPVPSVRPLGDKNPNVPNQVRKLAPKPVAKSNAKSGVNSSSSQAHSQTTELAKVKMKSGERPQVTGSDKQVTKGSELSGTIKNSSANSTNSGNNGLPTSNHNGPKMLTNPKKLKKKIGRPPDSSNSLDTELGIGEKQHLAHNVLFQLLKVTSQLPMVEFSYALDTLEILTDAFRLGQRVTLSIQRNRDGLFSDDTYGDGYFGWKVKSENHGSGGPPAEEDTRPLLASQVDGQLDHEDLLKNLEILNNALPEEPPRETMDVVPRSSRSNPLRGEGPPFVPAAPGRPSESGRGVKRSNEDAFFGAAFKRSKF